MKHLIDYSMPVGHVSGRNKGCGLCRCGKLPTLMVPLAAMLWLVSANPLRADIIFNDYGPAYTYNTVLELGHQRDHNPPAEFYCRANEFTPTITQQQWGSSVDFGVSLISGTHSVTLEITTDNGGVPGTVRESYSFANQMGSFGSQNSPLTATIPSSSLCWTRERITLSLAYRAPPTPTLSGISTIRE